MSKLSEKLASRVMVKFNIPFVINLPNGVYRVKTNHCECAVKLEMKIAQDNPSGLHGGARVLNDRFGHTNYTMAIIEFPFARPSKPEVGLNETAKIFSIDAINRILQVCRFASTEFFQHGIVMSDLGTITVQYYDQENKKMDALQEFHSPTVLATGTQNVLGEETIQRISELLQTNEKIPLDSILTKNASEYLQYGELRLCCIDIQSSIEFMVHKLIKENEESKNTNSEEISKILNHRFDDLKPYLKEATSHDILNTREYSQWREYCYKLRNDVVHKNKTPNYEETEKAYQTGVEFLILLKSFLKDGSVKS